MRQRNYQTTFLKISLSRTFGKQKERLQSSFWKFALRTLQIFKMGTGYELQVSRILKCCYKVLSKSQSWQNDVRINSSLEPESPQRRIRPSKSFQGSPDPNDDLKKQNTYTNTQYIIRCMSVLSKYEFNKLCNVLHSLQMELEDGSFDAKSKIDLESARLQFISQSLQGQSERLLHQGADSLLKIHAQANETKKYLKKQSDKLKKKVSEVEEEVATQMSELQRIVENSRQSKSKQLAALEKKLSSALSELERQSNALHELEMSQIQEQKQRLETQIQKCSKTLSSQRRQFVQEGEQAEQEAEKVKLQLLQRVNDLREMRRHKKVSFLELLEKVILKIKETENLDE